MTSVVLLASSGELGGAERVVLDILAGLQAAKPAWDLHLIVPRDGPLALRARELSVSVAIVPFGAHLENLGDSAMDVGSKRSFALRFLMAARSGIAAAGQLRRELQRIGPALVHAHGFKMQLLAMWGTPRALPLVLHLHDYVGQRRVMSKLLRAHPPRRLTAIAISQSVKSDAERVLGGNTPITVIYNALDTGHWTKNGPVADLDAAAGLQTAAAGTVRVGLVATMARWKGHETFLRALAMVPLTARVRGYVVGGSIYTTAASQSSIIELKALAASLGLSDRVGFTGFIEEPTHAMRALDIVVHASVTPEPFGRVIIEGMALERAVIMRALGGAAELVEHLETAYACQSGEPSELAEAITTLAANPELRGALGRGGRRKVEREFSRHRMIVAMLSVYSDAMEPTSRGQQATSTRR